MTQSWYVKFQVSQWLHKQVIQSKPLNQAGSEQRHSQNLRRHAAQCLTGGRYLIPGTRHVQRREATGHVNESKIMPPLYMACIPDMLHYKVTAHTIASPRAAPARCLAHALAHTMSRPCKNFIVSSAQCAFISVVHTAENPPAHKRKQGQPALTTMCMNLYGMPMAAHTSCKPSRPTKQPMPNTSSAGRHP